MPLRARRADGSLHPCSGTGFAIGLAIAWPLNSQVSPPYDVNYYTGTEFYAYWELFQLAYDGTTLHVHSAERLSQAELLPGWNTENGAMTNAIPDGDGFLLGMTGGRPGAGVSTGVMRWRSEGKRWRPVSFVPVSGGDDSCEPSLIRDVDGALLFCARGRREADYNDIRVWRSDDAGETWAKAIHIRGVVSSAPISINQAADGTPYVAANLYEVFLHPRTARLKVPRDVMGNVRRGGWTRKTLCIWPLNATRTGLETPVVARDCRTEFGPPPGGSTWRADHPSATTVQLADGAWHNVLGYRLLEYAELTHASDATPQTGAYLEEVISAGRAIPVWDF